MPDTYQGTELWDFSLVDPDNRRPVDYDRRRRMLQDLRSAAESAGGDLRELARDLVATKEDGRIKLYVTHRSLACRRDHPGLFTAGEYIPLAAEGSKAAHLFAFARRDGGRRRRRGGAAPGRPAGPRPRPPADGRRGLAGHPAAPPRPRPGPPLAQRSSPARS